MLAFYPNLIRLKLVYVPVFRTLKKLLYFQRIYYIFLFFIQNRINKYEYYKKSKSINVFKFKFASYSKHKKIKQILCLLIRNNCLFNVKNNNKKKFICFYKN